MFMANEIFLSSRLIGACLGALALDHRAVLDQESLALLERSRREAEEIAARLRSWGSPSAEEALDHVVVVTACIGSIREKSAFMGSVARGRIIDEAVARLQQLDELVDTFG